jgi:hypothetical protein
MIPSPPIRTTRPATLDAGISLILHNALQTDDFRRMHKQILHQGRDAIDTYGMIQRGAR